MLKMHEIREMIKLVDQSSLQEFELKGDEVSIRIKRQGTQTVSAVTPGVATAPVVKVVEPVSKPVVPAVQPKVEVQSKPAPVVAAPVSTDENLHKIISPMVGTFYRAPGEDAAPFVQPGDQVNKTTVVCILEAMKLFNEIEAEVEGEIVQVLVENGQLVEYGQPLFLVRPQS